MSTLSARAIALKPNAGVSALRTLWPLLVVVAFSVLMQMGVKPAVGPYPSNLLLTVGINITMAVSLNIVNGFTGQFSMGHAGFLAVGGYASGMLMYYVSMLVWGNADVHGGVLSTMPRDASGLSMSFGGGEYLFVGALVAGGLVAAAVGYLVGLPSLRLKGDYLAIVTLGFGEIVRVLLQNTRPVIKTAAEIRATPWYKLPLDVGQALGFGDIPKYTSLFWVYLVAGITLVTAFRLKTSTFGRAFLSIRENEIAAEAMGVNTTKYKVRAFVIAAFFAGIAGGLYASTLGNSLSPVDAGFLKSFDFIIMVVLGGLGSVSGAVLAAAIVTLLPEYLRGIADYRMIVYALALILMMIFRPQGLFGVHEVWDAALWRGLVRRFRGAGVAKAGKAGA